MDKEKFELENTLEENKREGNLTVINIDTKEENSLPYNQELLNEILSGDRPELFSQKNIQELESVENSMFGSDAEDIDSILNVLRNTKGVQLIFKNHNKISGYIASLPANEFNVNHRGYDSSDTNLYIESIAGKTEILKTMNDLKEKAKKAGFKKLSLHGINPRLNEILKSKFGFKEITTLHNWHNGKDGVYMELELENF